MIGTNPLGIGIPAADQPVVVDMATSKRAWGEIRVAKNSGQALPAASFIDSDGRPTLDPDAVHAALPTGDYKGFGLGLFIQVLGAFILVINPELTVGSARFKSDNQTFIDSIRHTPAAAGSDAVTLPGDRAAKTKHANKASGYLEVDDDLWRAITALL